MREINKDIKDLKDKKLTLKIEKNMTDYLSCQIKFSSKKDKVWMGQPHLIKKIQEKFGKKVEKLQIYKTPGTPHTGFTRPIEGDPTVSPEEHKEYRSGVGMLLYFVKHSRPDIANATRELLKLMDKPTPAAIKELHRTIKYVINTSIYGLKMHSNFFDENGLFELILFSDSDWAGDKETRKSVSGFCIFLQGCPISWKSKGQKSVSLSSSEVELMARSEAAKEIKFIYEILISMGEQVKMPIVCCVDNVGEIFIAENATATPKSKHINTRAKYVTQLISDGFLKVLFVKTDENLSDIFTKMCQEKHLRNM
jgi:hypothetical protein